MKLRIIPIKDLSVLQELVLQQTGAIEGEVQVIDSGINTDWGPLTLGLDAKGCLVVLLIGVEQKENLLSRLIGIYGWASQSLPLLSRCYAELGLDGAKLPRVVVIAPGFSRAVIDGFSYLVFTVEPFRYRVIEINRSRSLLLEPLQCQVLMPHGEKESDNAEALLNASQLTGAELRFFGEDRNFRSAVQKVHR